ncbi:hypothetical protein ACFL1H_04610, partial [Nanoarchaeota archaeon]
KKLDEILSEKGIKDINKYIVGKVLYENPGSDVTQSIDPNLNKIKINLYPPIEKEEYNIKNIEDNYIKRKIIENEPQVLSTQQKNELDRKLKQDNSINKTLSSSFYDPKTDYKRALKLKKDKNIFLGASSFFGIPSLIYGIYASQNNSISQFALITGFTLGTLIFGCIWNYYDTEIKLAFGENPWK